MANDLIFKKHDWNNFFIAPEPIGKSILNNYHLKILFTIRDVGHQRKMWRTNPQEKVLYRDP